MLSKFIELAIKQRVSVVIALLAVMCAAIIYIPKLNLDAFPDVTDVQVVVNTEAPGLAAEEVEKLITYPIEAVMYALPNVEKVRSISKTGLSGVTVVFRDGVEIDTARQWVFQRLQSAKELIPEGVGVPQLGPNTSGLGQVYQYLLIADENSGYDASALRSLNDWLVKLILLPADGVTEVLSFGGAVRQYQVNLNPSLLLSYGLTQQNVMDALENNNTNVGGWYINRGQEQLVIRGAGWLDHGEQGLRQIRQIPLKSVNGVSITIENVASVVIGGEIRQGAVTMTRRDESGRAKHLGEVVTGIVLKRVEANTNATIESIEARIALVEKALPAGVSIDVFYDQRSLIRKAVQTVVNALLIAFIFIAAVLALFLLNVRATLLVLMSVPISIGMALLVLSWFDLSANLMSLGGMAVAIGMLVDGSVVMVENIIQNMETQQHCLDPSHNNQITQNENSVILKSGMEVARPIFFATAIILVVFLPLFSFEGVEAKLFQPMAYSIIVCLISALVVALFVVPSLASYLFKSGFQSRKFAFWEGVEGCYRRLLKKVLLAKKVVLSLTVFFVVVTGVLLSRLGTEFIPELEEGTINLRVTLAPSASLDTALSVAPKLEKLLLSFPEVTYAMSRVGRAEIGGDPEPVNNIEIYIGLRPLAEWKTAENRLALQALMEERLSEFPGLLLNFSQPIATRVDELLSGVKAQLAIKLFGPDLSVLENKGKEIEMLVKKVSGTTDVALEQIAGESQLVVAPDRRALSRYGLSVSDVMGVVRDGIGGAVAGQIVNGNERYDIYVRLAEQFRQSREAISNLMIQAPSGAWLRLEDIAEVRVTTGAPQVRRDDVQRRVVIQANIQGRDMGSVVADIQRVIRNSVVLPPGYATEIGGQYENQQRSQRRMAYIIPASLGLIGLLLYFAFGSIGQAFLILLNVPLATVGGVFSLWLTGQYLSLPSAIGFITLFGVAVLNGVVLVECINRWASSKNSMEDAVCFGAGSRLRPVLMTALTSALGLIPMLMSTGVGSEIQKPLASVIVGGLFTSTILTLVVIPALYPVFSRHRFNE